jgi:hypothetical protein
LHLADGRNTDAKDGHFWIAPWPGETFYYIRKVA